MRKDIEICCEAIGELFPDVKPTVINKMTTEILSSGHVTKLVERVFFELGYKYKLSEIKNAKIDLPILEEFLEYMMAGYLRRLPSRDEMEQVTSIIVCYVKAFVFDAVDSVVTNVYFREQVTGIKTDFGDLKRKQENLPRRRSIHHNSVKYFKTNSITEKDQDDGQTK